MAISVRLGKALEARLRRHVAATGRSLADFVREAIDEKIASMPLAGERRPSPYELGKHLFGRDRSGRTDLATNHKKYFREAMRAKHRRHQKDEG